MLHPYKHQLLHNNDQRERLKQVENERLVQLISHPNTQMQVTVELSGLISKWWDRRWHVVRENRHAEGKFVLPET